MLRKSSQDALLPGRNLSMEAERAVGITEFVNEHWGGFSGILKHRLIDFKVSEVGLDGNVATISDMICDPAILPTKTDTGEVDVVTIETLKGAFEGVLEDANLLQSILDLVSGESKDDTLLTHPLPNKDTRTCVHQTVRSLFKGILQTEAEGECIRIYRRNIQLGDKRKRDHRNLQQPDQHRYLKFALYKENMDTLEVVQLLAKRLHIPAKDFSYAGTKDKRGVTVQWMVGRNVTPAKVMGINKLFEDGRLRVSNIHPTNTPLSLGDLMGNRFELVIRDIGGREDVEIETAIREYADVGFVNYFGLQRFGSSQVASHMIGMALLRGDYSGAINLVLDPRPGEPDERAVAARRHWKETANAAATQAMFPHRYTAERQILAHFARDPANRNDHLGAILSINRELRLMYVHSVQSYLWNRAASERHRKWGRRLAVGDLVDNGQVMITEDNIKNYAIEDLVLPMPGYNSTYPTTVDFQEALQSLNIESLNTAFKPKNKALWDLPGAYRKVYTIPGNVQHSLGRYSSTTESVIMGSEGEHRGLWLAFDLPTSSYATMAIRELMHTSTDPKHHKELTKNHS